MDLNTFLEMWVGSSLMGMSSALLNFFVILLCLRIFDKLSGRRFDDELKKISNDPKALGMYYGFRILACGIAAGLAA